MMDSSEPSATQPRRWWIHICSLGWIGLRFFWGTIVLGLLINGIISLIFLSQGTNLHALFVGRALDWVNQHLLLTGSVTLSIAALTCLTWIGSRQDRTDTHHQKSTIQGQQSRDAFVRVLRLQYTKELIQPLEGATLMALELHERFDLTRTPAQTVFRRVDHAEHSLPPDTTILKAYDDAGNGLLILGEPGAGKTTLLLELACDLLDRAKMEPTHPIPVILNLSTWIAKKEVLSVWLVEELLLRYSLPRRLGQEWVKNDQLLLLLDGLDEVMELALPACINAINEYHEEHFVPLVVCSRSREYLSQQERLALPSAVVVQPLTNLQVKSYLTQTGRPMAAARKVLQTNQVLQKLMTTPLILNIVIQTYRYKTGKELPQIGSKENQQQQIFDTYVTRMLEQREIRGSYTPTQTIHWLIWLAQQMKQHNKTVFYIEQIQPSWITKETQLRIYKRLAIKLPGALIGALVTLLFNTLLFGFQSIEFILITGFVGGLIGGLFSLDQIGTNLTAGRQASMWKQLGRYFIPALGNGVFVALTIGLVLVWKGSIYYALTNVIFFGLSCTLFSMLVRIRLSMRKHSGRTQTLSTARSWKWNLSLFIEAGHLENGMLVGLIFGLTYGLSFIFDSNLDYRLDSHTISHIIFDLGYLPSIGLVYGLTLMISGIIVSILVVGRKEVIQPAEIMVWSWSSLQRSLFKAKHLRTALVVGLSAVVIFGLSDLLLFVAGYGHRFWLGLGLGFGLDNWLIVLLSYGLSFGLSYWILVGLFQGVSSEAFDEQRRVVPNQGIRRSARNGLFMGIISAGISGLICIFSSTLSYGLSYGLYNWLSYGLPDALVAGLIVGITGGLLAGLLSGGLAWLQHYFLRFILWKNGSIPWHYPSFLDETADRILLRKVGGGFSFIHSLFLDYFARLNTTTPSGLPIELSPHTS